MDTVICKIIVRNVETKVKNPLRPASQGTLSEAILWTPKYNIKSLNVHKVLACCIWGHPLGMLREDVTQ